MGIIGNVKEEIRLIRERDPAIHSSMEVFLMCLCCLSEFPGDAALPCGA